MVLPPIFDTFDAQAASSIPMRKTDFFTLEAYILISYERRGVRELGAV